MKTDRPLLGFGEVRHTRLRPRHHAFVYPTCFLMLPMRSLPDAAQALAINRRGALSFYDTDHGDGRSPAQGGALAWLDGLLQAEGIEDATGQVWLHCYPREQGLSRVAFLRGARGLPFSLHAHAQRRPGAHRGAY